jgi:hypothetical protein
MHLKWNNSFNRVLASSVAVFVAATNLYAIPRGPCEPPPPPVCCEEPKPGPFAFAYPYDLNLSCPRDFYIHVDGLAMQAKQDGMQWAISNTHGNISAYPLTNGQVIGYTNSHRDWKYNWGARVGAGFYLDHDAWNIDANWTWLKISDYKTESVTTSGGNLIPLWALGTNTDSSMYSQGLSSVWDGNYDTLDLRLGKPYHVSRYLVFNPHFGARAAWINQHFSVDYSGTNGSTSRYIHHADNQFWGVGARAGLDTKWIFGKGFYLFGDIATSLLYGKFEIEQHLTTPASATGFGGNAGFDLDDDHYMNVPNFELSMGLAWGTPFSCNQYYVALKAGYEFHYWWNQLNLRRFWSGGPSYSNDVVARGDLSLSGFSLSLQFDM